MKKIISFYYRGYNTYNPPVGTPYYYLNGWDGLIFRHLIQKKDDYLLESWRFEKEVNTMEERVVDGITCKLFPAKKYPVIGLWTNDLIKCLRKEMEDGDVILHLFTCHSLASYILTFIFRKSPIVLTNLGARPPLLEYQNANIFKKKLYYLFLDFVERRAYQFVDYFHAGGLDSYNYYLNYIDKNKLSKLNLVGIDFNNMKPINKVKARKQIGIQTDKKVMIYAGRLYELKGVDLLLRTFTELKKKYDVHLILIGGYPNDPLFEKARKSGAEIHFRYDADVNPFLYFSAADVYLNLTYKDELFLKFGGTGIAPIEAMACGTPVVSFALRHFPSDKDLKYVGKIPDSPEDIVKCVSDIFDHPEKYRDCRKIAKKHRDWDIVISKLVKVYDRLFEKYEK